MTPSKPIKSPAYLWFDTEFTSLDLNEAQLLQVAMLATDISLNRLWPPAQDVNLYIKLSPSSAVSEWVENNLSEILVKCRSGNAVPAAIADRILAESLDRLIGPTGSEAAPKPVLAGNTIHMDMALVRKFLPAFASRLHYRMLDVSVLKMIWLDWLDAEGFDKDNIELLQKYLPRDCSIPAGASHDAYYDIHASLAELRFYREKMALCRTETAAHHDKKTDF